MLGYLFFHYHDSKMQIVGRNLRIVAHRLVIFPHRRRVSKPSVDTALLSLSAFIGLSNFYEYILIFDQGRIYENKKINADFSSWLIAKQVLGLGEPIQLFQSWQWWCWWRWYAVPPAPPLPPPSNIFPSCAHFPEVGLEQLQEPKKCIKT